MQRNWSALYRDELVLNLTFNLSPWEFVSELVIGWKVACSDNDYKERGCMPPQKYTSVPGKSHCELVTSGLHIWSFFFEPNLTLSSAKTRLLRNAKTYMGNSLQWKEGMDHRKDMGTSLLKKHSRRRNWKAITPEGK